MAASVGLGGTLLLLAIAILAAYFVRCCGILDRSNDAQNTKADLEAKNQGQKETASTVLPLPPRDSQKPSAKPDGQIRESTATTSASPTLDPYPPGSPAAPQGPTPSVVPEASAPSTPTAHVPSPPEAPSPIPSFTPSSSLPAPLPVTPTPAVVETVKTSPITTQAISGTGSQASGQPTRSFLLPAFLFFIVMLSGGMGAMAIFVLQDQRSVPPADAGAAWATAVAKLPRTRLPLVQEYAADNAMRGSSVSRKLLSTPLNGNSSSGSAPKISIAIPTSAHTPAPAKSTLSSSSSSSSPSSVLSSSASLSQSTASSATPSPSPSPAPSPIPSAVGSQIPSPPSHAPPAPPDAQVDRSDLAFSSSRFMMGIVGKNDTPAKDVSPPATPAEGTPTKTWKFKEAEAKRKEEVARLKQDALVREGSGGVVGSPSAPQAQLSAAALTESNSSSSVGGSASHLIDPNDSEDGARKEEARLARSMSKKGAVLRPGV